MKKKRQVRLCLRTFDAERYVWRDLEEYESIRIYLPKKNKALGEYEEMHQFFADGSYFTHDCVFSSEKGQKFINDIAKVLNKKKEE